MIRTLTLNPSVDRTITLDDLALGEVNRATSSRVDAGGKGVNVTRALSLNDVPSLAVLPLGGTEGLVLARLLDDAEVAYQGVPITGTVRMNVAAVQPDGTTTKLNEVGPRLSPSELANLEQATLAGDSEWIVGCGSLPPGVDDDFYARLVTSAAALGKRTAIDTSGSALRHAVEASPTLIKPNHEELAELVQHPLKTLGDVVRAADEIVRTGVPWVVVSLGQHGAVAVDESGAAWCGAQVTNPVSTVGAGDCLLAGLLHSLHSGADLADALRSGVVWGAAAVGLPGSRVPGAADLARISPSPVSAPDPSLSLL